MAPYSERYVAFIDILGFRSLVENFAKKREFPGPLDVRNLLRVVHERPGPDVEEFKTTADFRVQSISDAVALSASLTPEGLDHLFFTIRQLAFQLLQSGILIRGAITKGKLWHDDQAVFGEGLLRAYDFESRIARYPRVIVSKDVSEDVQKYTQRAPWKAYFKGNIKQADDGPMFLHILYDLSGPKGWQGPAELIQTTLQNRFDNSIDEPAIFEKVQWFCRYWNEVLPGGFGIRGPGLFQKGRFD